MSQALRIATFNLENFDDKPDEEPTLAERIRVMRPQLARLRADVLCLQEVNGQERPNQPRELAALRTLVEGTAYSQYHLAHTVTTGGEAYDERNLAVLSRFPITGMQQIRHDRIPKPLYRKVTANPAEPEADEVTWERPILYVTLDLGGERTLHVLVVHLKSKIPSNIPGQKITNYRWRTVSGWAEGYFLSSLKRVGQALETRVLIDQIFDQAEPDGEGAWIAVCGDFNAAEDAVPVQAIIGPVEATGNPALIRRVLIPCERNIPLPSRHSLFYLGRGEMLDHVLASRSLLGLFDHTEIHNEALPDESGAFRTDVQFPESDHAPVVAQFTLP